MNNTQALLNLASNVNEMKPAAKLGFFVKKTEIGVLKINKSCTSSVYYMLALLDLKSKVNIIHPTFAQKLGLRVGLIDIEAQKIVNIILDIYGMLVANFLVIDKVNLLRFFKKIFLVANVSLEIVLRMLFVILSNANIDFLE